ncbi:S8 family serine peptidase [Glycomyces harbinensis]|uniref:PA domain-containing protein n=1 Tax=Glycomyces harbinensis TaxID=58114 RepID=A0A1G6VXM6_9ACTN|nr:S8 family serine peptidase [Glycomyces harbinensis]SDD58318.1 PA domain-containing protein [Glycomyces harbinensis]
MPGFRTRPRRRSASTALPHLAAHWRPLLAASLALPLLVSSAPAAEAKTEDGPAPVWLVELVPGASADALEAAAHDLDYTLRHDFERVWNGVSVEADPATARRLEGLDLVEEVWSDVVFTGPARVGTTPDAPAESGAIPELAQAIETTRAADAHERGITGEGVKVGVIDTGIDYTHPDLGGCFGRGCRVVTGADFVGDEFDSDDPENAEPVPDDDPADCGGHGTHVAGIVGANGQVTGVAPDARFGAYKVFGCEGSTSSEVIMQALEAALDDGMDVVNLSLGQSFQWPGYPTAEAADRLTEEGVVVVASMGNDGEAGVYSGSAPGVGEDVIAVASTDNPSERMEAAFVPGLDRAIGYRVLDATPAPEPGTATDELVWLGRACADDASEGDVNGKAALIIRGTCTFKEKYARAVAEGATSVVVYNDRSGPFGGAGVEDLGVPMVSVTDTDGADLRDLTEIGEGPVLEFTDETVLVDLPRAGLASAFTAYGPAPDLQFKPDLAAPGGGIWSTVPVADGSYESLSGTSMSSPHVAGAAALLLDAEPRLEPREVRTRLANSAKPVAWGDNPDLGELEAAHRQGTGVIDVIDALDAEACLYPTGVNVGDGTEARTFELTLTSRERAARSYALTHQSTIATTGDDMDPGFHAAEPKVTFAPQELTLYPGQSATVEVTVEPSEELPLGSVFGGRITARPEGDGESLTAAYSGYQGDYLAIPVLEHPDYPSLAAVVGQDAETREFEYRDLEDGEKFSIAEGPDVAALVFLGHQVAEMEVSATNVDSGAIIEWEPEAYLPRSPGPGDAMAIHLEDLSAQRPDAFEPGQWTLEVRVLKALGDPANPDHWEQWTSPAFTLTD